MDERGLMIDFRNPDVRGGVLFLIEDDGSGVCFLEHKNLRAGFELMTLGICLAREDW